jgi:hypothetical protein
LAGGDASGLVAGFGLDGFELFGAALEGSADSVGAAEASLDAHDALVELFAAGVVVDGGVEGGVEVVEFVDFGDALRGGAGDGARAVSGWVGLRAV